MKNKNNHLKTWAAIFFALGSSTFYSYGEVKNADISALGEAVLYGEASIEGAHNIRLQRSAYPSRTDFTPSLINMDDNAKDSNLFALDATLKIGAKKNFTIEDRIVRAVIEFKTTKRKVQVSQFYASWDGWSIGIQENNFCKIATFSAVKNIQVSWEKALSPRFLLAIGVGEGKEFKFYGHKEKDTAKAKAADLQLRARKDLPAASTRLQYSLANNLGDVELSGLLRPLAWDNKGKKPATTTIMLGYGVNLGAKLNLRPDVDKLIAHFIFGQGIGDYIADLALMQEIEASSVYKSGSDVKAIMNWGAYSSLEHRWTSALRSNLDVGITYILGETDTDRKLRPTAYKTGFHATGNLMYWVTQQTAFGVEMSLGARKNLAKDSKFKEAFHVKAMATFKI